MKHDKDTTERWTEVTAVYVTWSRRFLLVFAAYFLFVPIDLYIGVGAISHPAVVCAVAFACVTSLWLDHSLTGQLLKLVRIAEQEATRSIAGPHQPEVGYVAEVACGHGGWHYWSWTPNGWVENDDMYACPAMRKEQVN